jgi:hypothetical protein
MTTLKIRFATLSSLLTSFLLFIAIIATPAIYYRSNYKAIYVWELLLYPGLIMLGLFLILIFFGISRTYWMVNSEIVTITTNNILLFGKRKLIISLSEIVSVKRDSSGSNYQKLTISLSNGKRFKFYHHYFLNDSNFRQLGRVLRRSIRKSG